MAGGGQGSGGMGGGQGAGGMGGPVSGTMGGAGGDLGTASYIQDSSSMNKGGFDGGFGGGYGGGMGGFGGGYGMGSPFGGFGMGMPGMGYGGGMGGFGMGMGSPFGGFGGMPMYGGYGGGMGGYGGFGGMPMYGGFDGGMGGFDGGMSKIGYGGGMGGFDGGMKGGFGGFSRGMGSPFRGGMGGMRGGFRGRAPLPDQLARPAVEPRQPDQFPGDFVTNSGSGIPARPAVMPQQPDQFPPAFAAVLPQQPAPDALTGGPAEVINKGMTKPYIEPAAPAAPQIPTVPEAPAMGSRGTVETKDNVPEGVPKPGTEAMSSYVERRPYLPIQGGIGKPWYDPRVAREGEYAAPTPGGEVPNPVKAPWSYGSAQEAYDQTLAAYLNPDYERHYLSLAPSTRPYLQKPPSRAEAEVLAERARQSWVENRGKDPFGRGMKGGGIASLRRYADGGTAKDDSGDDTVTTTPKEPYVPDAKPVDISDKYQTYRAPTHVPYTPGSVIQPPIFAYKPTPESMLGRNVRPEIMAKKYSLPARLVKPGMSYREPFLYGPYQPNPKGISGLLK